MTGEVLADDLNHPESPFFRVPPAGTDNVLSKNILWKNDPRNLP